MKKIVIAAFAFASIAFWSCEKEQAATTPTACFTISGIDSSKVAGFSATRIDSIIKFRMRDYFITVGENTATGVYKKILFFDNCGDAANYRVLYTGDASHMYLTDLSNPGTATGTQTGINFLSDTLSYTYAAGGTYKITLISSNVADKGTDIKRATATKTIILK